jgi:hypothetical protein
VRQDDALVDDFVVALSQLAMNLHAKTHELKNLLLVKQLTHLRGELREPAGRTRITRIVTKFIRLDPTPESIGVN